MVNLEQVAKSDRYIIHNLMQFYMYEFSKYIPTIKLESNGLYAPSKLEDYWTDPNLHVFFIKKEEEIIGFALLESESSTSPNTMIEFFIVSKYKGRGFGKEAATKLFHMFPGKWRITQIEKNIPAQAFWRNLIHGLTKGELQEWIDDQKCSVQEFHTDSIRKR